MEQQVAQQDGLTETAVQIGQSRFGTTGIRELSGQGIPVLIELDEAHLEERQAEDLVLAGGIAQHILRQQHVAFFIGQPAESKVLNRKRFVVLPAQPRRLIRLLDHDYMGELRTLGRPIFIR